MTGRTLLLWLWLRLRRVNRRAADRLAPRRLRDLVERVDGADYCFGVPGGYLMAKTWAADMWTYHLPNLALPRFLGKTVVLMPCSVGPFKGPHGWAAKWLLRGMTLVAVRDEPSVRLLRDLGVSEQRIMRTPDLALTRPLPDSVDPETAEREEVERWSGPRVACSVREYYPFDGERGRRAYREYHVAMLDALRKLAADGAKIVMVAQCEEDVALTRKFARELADLQPMVVDRDMTPGELGGVYGACDMLIATRMHAAIIGLQRGTPVAAIAYEAKHFDAFRDVGIGECVVDMCQPESIWPTVELVWSGREALVAEAEQGLQAVRRRGQADLDSLVTGSR
jgi:colanic acid/amylovoran biosynthesis protein